jgi:large subunit ribosomal protein L15
VVRVLVVVVLLHVVTKVRLPRSGYSRKIGFEGGQMPLQRRLPKFGFTNINRVEFAGINLDTLQKRIADEHGISTFDQQVFIDRGLVSKNDLIKILGRGELKAKVDVKAHAFSDTAKNAIEKLGGSTATL